MTPGKRRVADLQLQNCFSVLVAGKGEKAIHEEATETPDEPCMSTKRKSCETVVGDSPLELQKAQFADLTFCLGKSVACWHLGSSMLQRNCQGLSGPCTISRAA